MKEITTCFHPLGDIGAQFLVLWRGYRLRGGSREASRMRGIIHGESDLLAIGHLERVPVGILDQGPIAHGGAGVFRAE